MEKGYHELKLEEARRASLEKLKADIDYNIMMGNLDDPEEENDE